MAVNIKISLVGCDTILSGWLVDVNVQRYVSTRLHGVIPEHCSATFHIYITTIATYHIHYHFLQIKTTLQEYAKFMCFNTPLLSFNSCICLELAV